MHGIAPRIFKGKLNLKSRVEWRNVTDLSRAVSIPSSFGLLITSQLSYMSHSKPAGPGLVSLFTPAAPSDLTQPVMSQDLSRWREWK